MTTAQIEQSEVRDAASARLASLLSERAAVVRQLKQTKGRHGEDRYLAKVDKWIAEARTAIAQAESVGIRVKD